MQCLEPEVTFRQEMQHQLSSLDSNSNCQNNWTSIELDLDYSRLFLQVYVLVQTPKSGKQCNLDYAGG